MLKLFMKNMYLFALILFLILLSFFLEDKSKNNTNNLLSTNSTVLAFGDSLTFGYGVKTNESYPAKLANLSGLNVINAGISGELSFEGLKRLENLLDKHKPKLLILCHGGNDILRRKSHDKLRYNIKKMIDLALAKNINVLLVGVPNFYTLGYGMVDLYEELAEEMDTMYEDNILSTVLTKSSLKSDQIHPNAKGYEMMAEAFFYILKDNGFVK